MTPGLSRGFGANGPLLEFGFGQSYGFGPCDLVYRVAFGFGFIEPPPPPPVVLPGVLLLREPNAFRGTATMYL